jgi:hypothetical protein
LRGILRERMGQFRRSLAGKMLTFATGRGLEGRDRVTVDEICNRMMKDGDRFSAMVIAVVQSDAFKKRRVYTELAELPQAQ